MTKFLLLNIATIDSHENLKYKTYENLQTSRNIGKFLINTSSSTINENGAGKPRFKRKKKKSDLTVDKILYIDISSFSLSEWKENEKTQGNIERVKTYDRYKRDIHRLKKKTSLDIR